MRWGWAFFLAVLVPGTVSAEAGSGAVAPRVGAGIFGDTYRDGETGDVGGIELRVVRRDGHDFVEFYIAEGACGDRQISSLQHDGERWRFDYNEQDYVLGGDRRSKQSGPRYYYTFWISADGNGVRLQTDDNGSSLIPSPDGAHLGPVRQAHCFHTGRN